MPALLFIVAIALLNFGCHSQSKQALVVEDGTTIVAPDRTTTEALGIETLGGVFTPLIKTGTLVPCSVSEVFSTAVDSQSQIMVKLYRGTNQMAANNKALGNFQVTGIHSAPRGTPQIEITFAVTQRQILLSARDLKTNTDMQLHKVEADSHQ